MPDNETADIERLAIQSSRLLCVVLITYGNVKGSCIHALTISTTIAMLPFNLIVDARFADSFQYQSNHQ